MEIIGSSEYEIFNNYYEEGDLIKKILYMNYPVVSNQNMIKEKCFDFIEKEKLDRLCEFSWFPILIGINISMHNYLEILTQTISNFKSQKYLECNLLTSGSILVTGNGRAWKNYIKEEYNEISNLIKQYLNELNPLLFNFRIQAPSRENVYFIEYIGKDIIRTKEKTIDNIPLIDNKNDDIRDIHDWISVIFNDVSKTFISEISQHRNFSTSVYNDYYIPRKDFKFIIDTNSQLKNKVDIDKINDCLKVVQSTYNYLINRGHKRDLIMQLLPLGITNKFAIAGRISDWKDLFKSINDDTYWEVRLLLNDLKEELIQEYKYNF